MNKLQNGQQPRQFGFTSSNSNTDIKEYTGLGHGLDEITWELSWCYWHWFGLRGQWTASNSRWWLYSAGVYLRHLQAVQPVGLKK